MRGLGLLVMLAGCGRLGFDPSEPGGSSALRIAQVVAGSSHTCARSQAGEIKCWGTNEWGILGIPSDDPSSRGDQPGELEALAPIDLGTGVTARHVVTLADFTCALLSDDSVRCWGNNDGGQLGTGDFTFHGVVQGDMGNAIPHVAIDGSSTFEQVITGHYHTCVLRAGQVWCLGLNDVDQDGQGDSNQHVADLATLPPIDLGAFAPVELAAEFNSTCARDAGGRVKCWGYNPTGQLGLGDTNTRGDRPSNMGDALPLLDFGGGLVSEIRSGYGLTCVVIDDGVRCWGAGDHGDLGTGNVDNQGDDPGELAQLAPLPLGAPVTHVAVGQEFACALLDTGEVACWGQNNRGQLGLGDTADRGDDPGEIGPALRVPLPARAVQIAAGGFHACAVLETDELACWGDNSDGALGADDTANRGDDPGELPAIIPAATLFP